MKGMDGNFRYLQDGSAGTVNTAFEKIVSFTFLILESIYYYDWVAYYFSL